MQLSKQLLLLFTMISLGLQAQNLGVKLADGTSPNTTLDVNGAVSYREGTALTLTNGANSNIALTDYSFFRITGPTAAFSITGFAGGNDGRVLTIMNNTSQVMTLTHQATSTAANQINTGGTNTTIAASGMATLYYNTNLSKWVVTAVTGVTPTFTTINIGNYSDSMIVINNGIPGRVPPREYIETYAWGLDGNAGTVDGTHFLGTMDNIPLSIRINNQKAGRIAATGETYLGYLTGNAITTGTYNTFIGDNVGVATTTGSQNVGLGSTALLANIGGSRNTALGESALEDNTSGGNNTAVGRSSIKTNLTGSNNTAIGVEALMNTVNSGNTGVGYQSGITNTTGTNNTSVGFAADVTTTGLTNATAIGYNAKVAASNSLILGSTGANAVNVGINTTTPQYKLDINAQTGSAGNPLRLLGLNAGATSDSLVTSASGVVRRVAFSQFLGSSAWLTTGNAGTVDGTNFMGTTDNIPLSIRVNNQKAGRIDHLLANSFWGYQAGNAVTTGSYNTAMGQLALAALTQGTANIGVGTSALTALTTGSDNVAVGSSTLATMTTGNSNVAIGNQSGLSNTTGVRNVSIGYQSARNGTHSNSIMIGYQAGMQNAASNNVFIGSLSGPLTSTGSDNIGMGYYTLFNNTTGRNNIGIGSFALSTTSGAWGNTAIGHMSSASIQTGQANTALGDSSLMNNVLGHNNTHIGYRAGLWTTGSNNIAIGYNAMLPVSTADNQLALGTWLYGTNNNLGINTISPQYKLDIDANTGSTGNPLRLQGLSAGSTSDSLVTSASGVIRRLNFNQFSPWAYGSGTNSALLHSSSNVASGGRSVVSGQSNTASALNSSVLGGNNNLVSGESSSILGGNNNTISSNYSSIIGGTGNSLTGGVRSTILGGQNLTLSGANVLGFNGNTTAVSLSDANMFHLGDADLWLGNTTNTARSLRFYEPNSSGTYSGTHYTALKAGTQSSDITYTLPTAAPSVSGHVLSATTGGVMSWINPSTSAWSTTGNSGTVDGTNFLGTTDNVPLSMRVNNILSGYIGTAATSNTFLGYQAGLVNTANENTFIGYQAGFSNTSATNNTAVGSLALSSNTTGSLNTAVGQDAMRLNTTGTQNTALGESALELNTIGGSNTALGHEALASNTIGERNVAIGSQALEFNVTAGQNLSMGSLALHLQSFNNGGVSWNSDNIAFGYQSLYNNQPTSTTNGYRNIAIGTQSLTSNTTGSTNIAIGYQAGNTITTGSNNTLLGNDADVSSATLTNATAIGANAVVSASNSLILGNSVNVGIGVTSPSVKLHQDNGNATANYHKFTAGTTTGTTSSDGFDVGVDASGNAVLNQKEALPLIMSANNAEVMRVTSAGNVLIGGNLTPGEVTSVALVNQSASDQKDDMTITTYNTTTTPAFVIFKARGTAAAPTALTNSELIGGFNANGYTGSAFTGLTAITSVTASDYTTSFGADIAFKTTRSGTSNERMRIMSTGNVGIGVAAPTNILHINGQGRSTSTTWTTTSDIRLKNIDGKFEYGLKELLKINTYRFHYKKDNPLNLPTNKAFQGVMAQDLQKVIPEAVTKQADGYLTVNSDPVFWTMLNSIKELNSENEKVKAENNALKSELNALKMALNKQGIMTENLISRLEKLEAALNTKSSPDNPEKADKK